MKNKLKRLWTLLLTCMIFVCSMGAAVSAANVAVSGGSITLKKYLVMDQDANVPNAEFSYTVKTGKSQEADLENIQPEILAGKDAEKIKITSTAFQVEDVTYTEKQSGDSSIILNNGEKYARKEMNIDLNNVTYTAPGIYRYEITENNTSEQGITKDSSTIFMLVSVASDDNGNLNIADIVFQNEEGQKTDGFMNRYETDNLTLRKVVTGNQGDRNKYFMFTVMITGADPGTKYDVEGGNHTNPVQLEADAEGSATGVFYLKHDETITIKGLTKDTSYVITENDYSKEGYATSNSISDAAENATGNTTGNTAGNTTGNTMSNTTGKTTVAEHNGVTFTNNKDVATPTGVAVTIAPYLAMIALAAAIGFFFFFRKKSREM